MEFASPAKINWFFRVLGKRKDGFHSIASLLSAINICDTLYFASSDRDIYQTNSNLEWNPHNLIHRAVHLFRKVTEIQQPIKIEHIKQIPVEAGLGGGSSNAATTLWGLNTLLGQPLTNGELLHMGATLGADVPFFFSSGFAFVQGIGEKITNLIQAKPITVQVEVPFCKGLSTKKVYNACVPNEASLVPPQTLVQKFFQKKLAFVNDLEPTALRLLPELREIKREIQCQVANVGMTGSGTAFFHTAETSYMHRGIGYTARTLQREKNTWYSSTEKIPSNI